MSEPRRGRVRSETARRAILEATRDQLAEHGYDKLSMDRVAAAAGVGKQTVYRWWPSKSAVVAECVLAGYVLADMRVVADTGDLRSDVRAWLMAFVDFVDRDPAAGGLVRALASAAAESDAVATHLYDRFTATAESHLAARLADAERRGQLRDGIPAVMVAEMLFGTVLYRFLVRQDITPEFVDRLCDAIFNGIAAPR
ncbi:TetR/AcrR family transcriptional regulator [Nonomuraea antimicrobica]|uniref:TetR/AcrR family transcriptional regulator n=1 Tax=Nonomuraea antimicrobica TaxID=561173 RepID=A0ABP7B4C4_9ACTN